MSGNGGDNAHNNAFSGGKNPGIGNSGSGSNSGTSGNGGQEVREAAHKILMDFL
jgi:hypothetical protein